MPSSTDPRRLYLKQRGAQWFLNYPIPKKLQEQYLTANGVPRTHVVVTTGTSDLNEANEIKFGLIHRLNLEFKRKTRESAGALPADLRTAKELAATLQEAANGDNYELAEVLQEVITTQAENIYAKGGKSAESLRRAQGFVRVATGGKTLMDAFEDWIDSGTLPERTRSKYRTAVQEFATFLGGIPLATDVTKKNALRYVDWLNREARSQRTKKVVPLSYNTKKDRVMAMSAFWNLWLLPRELAPEPVNPWSRLPITEKPTGTSVKWDDTSNTGRPQRRDAFEDSEILAILDAPGPAASAKYKKPLLMELFALALLTGARPDELCSLRLEDIKDRDGVVWLNFVDTKTKDDREIPLVHPLALGLLERRIGKRRDPEDQLFPELRPKGKGDNLYELVGRALGRHLDRAKGLGDGDVPYMTRHTFLTHVGNMEGIQDHALKRYVGHKPEGMTDRHYRGVRPEALTAVARKVQYSDAVEARLSEVLGVKVEAKSEEPVDA